jgi:SAM-dependent methyltransferase
MLDSGAVFMYAVEKYGCDSPTVAGIEVVRTTVEELKLPIPVDFVFSNDVLEHVLDVKGTMDRVYDALVPGGRFVSSTDLRGHNCYRRPGRELDFLTCPNWLWRTMFSHIETTNRVRRSQLVDVASSAGFRVLTDESLASADPAYVQSIRPRLLPQFCQLADDDLRCLQHLLVLEKPLSS